MTEWKLEDIKKRNKGDIPDSIGFFFHKQVLAHNKKHQIYNRYGITINDVLNIFDNQGGICAICKKKLNLYKKRDTHIDHDHTTDKIRGLLCMTCNMGLGSFKDNINFLENAILYLKTSKKRI